MNPLIFNPMQREKSYYTNPTEDAILMILEPLDPHNRERRKECGNAHGSQAIIHTIS